MIAGQLFGYSVSSAGDTNDDGYDDVIIGAYGWNLSRGRAYIYNGGSSMNAIADVTMSGVTAGDQLGYSVAGAGDTNGDDYDDVIVGVNGSAYIYHGGSLMDNATDITLSGSAAAYFGNSVSGAGDINKDGYDDVIVGAHNYSSSTGRAYIYHGGSSMDATADVTFTGENTGDMLGSSVSSADINRDGHADAIVGAIGYLSGSSRGKVYIYSSNIETTWKNILSGSANFNTLQVKENAYIKNAKIDDVAIGRVSSDLLPSEDGQYFIGSGETLDNVADAKITGDTNNKLGYSVADAGDVNGDGHDDIIVGTYNEKKAYIFFGNSLVANLSIENASITLGSNDEYFGYSVSSAGDVNGDGYDDVIVGARAYNASTGRAYIYYGGPSMDSIADVTLTGGTNFNEFGYSVSSAGDVDGDGLDDVIVGALRYNSYQGRAYVFYGSSFSSSTISAGSADVTLTGETGSSYFGRSVSSAGDVDGDGLDDVIVGADAYNSSQGRAYVFYGSSFSSSTISAGSADVTLTGETAGDAFGYSVSSAGNVNNDQYDDLIIGAAEYGSRRGRAYVFYGSASLSSTISAGSADVTLAGETTNNQFGCSVSSADDVNGDGYDDVIIGAMRYNFYQGRAYIYYGGSAMDATGDVTFTGEAVGDYFGFSVSSAGDINNDSYADAVVSARDYSIGGSDQGRVYVFSSGIKTTWRDAIFKSASLNTLQVTGNAYVDNMQVGDVTFSKSKLGVAEMDSLEDWIFIGASSGDRVGYSVAHAGDINADGYPDVIIGAPEFDSGGLSNNGAMYIHFGGPSMDNMSDLTITGSTNGMKLGYKVSSAGDFNGDGYDDVATGGPEYSSDTYTNNGRVDVWKGPSATSVGFAKGVGTNEYFGKSITFGNFDGDLFDDVAAGTPNFSSNRGKVNIYKGGSTPDLTSDANFGGVNNNDNFAMSLASADVTGDGIDELIVGASGFNSSNGRVYIYKWIAWNSWSEYTVSPPLTTTDEQFGYSVANIGDINGDGKEDLLIGAPFYNGAGDNRGRAYIYYGTTSGATYQSNIIGATNGDEFGYSVASPGDVNNDGVTDLLIGARGRSCQCRMGISFLRESRQRRPFFK